MKQGDGPSTVIIRGQHLGHPITATWSRQTAKDGGPAWSLTIQYRGRQRRFGVDPREQPCWTVTLRFVVRVIRYQLKKHDKLRIVG
jgi:hypothetical protein